MKKLLLFVLLISTFAFGQTATILSGTQNVADYTRNNGYNNGAGIHATFKYPTACAISSDLVLHVWDGFTNVERLVAPNGFTDEGSGNALYTDYNPQNPTAPYGFLQYGYSDGFGSMVRFNNPMGAYSDKFGNTFLADTYNNRIRKKLSSGEWTTIAGSGVAGSLDGQGLAAQFNKPQGLCVDDTGNIYVADSGNKRLRKISASGLVTTISGTIVGLKCPVSVAVDASGNIYVSDKGSYNIKKIATDGTATLLASLVTANGIAFNSKGVLLFTDASANNIKQISTSGVVSIWMDNGIVKDGTVKRNRFDEPYGIAVDANDNVYVTNRSGQNIIKITP